MKIGGEVAALRPGDIYRRIAVWAGLGLVVVCCWQLYIFLTPRDHLVLTLRLPIVQALTYITCPVFLAGRYLNFQLSLWTVAAMNTLTYAAIGTMVEAVRRIFGPAATA